MKKTVIKNQNGAALITSLMLMSLLTVIGFSALNDSDIELKIAGNERVSAQALYAAEAGVQHAIAGLRVATDHNDRWDDDSLLAMPSNVADEIPVEDGAEYTAGSAGDNGDYVFGIYADAEDDTAQIISTGTVGRSVRNLHVRVEKAFGGSAISFGAFGETLLTIHNSGNVRSYDSREVANPTDRDSDDDGIYDSDTLEGDVGSNQQIDLYSKSYVSGDVSLGEDVAGDSAELDAKSNVIILGGDSYTVDENGDLILTGENIDRVENDVLFTNGGTIAQSMDVLDNYNGPYDDLDQILSEGGLSAGDYYFQTISTDVLSKDVVLNVDNSSADSVNIYIFGDLVMGNGSGIQIKTAVEPQEFSTENGGTLVKNDVGEPVLVDDAGDVVTEGVDGEFYTSDDTLAEGQVRGYLANNLGDYILDIEGNKVLMDSIYYLTGEDTVYSGMDLPGGKVNMFISGSVEFKNGSTINNYLYDAEGGSEKALVDKADDPVQGPATVFSLYSLTMDKIDLKNSSEISGLIYAPYAQVLVHNSADVYGAIYGSDVDIRNSGDIWFDTALKDEGGGAEFEGVKIISWREL
jgi:hypothetical protein